MAGIVSGTVSAPWRDAGRPRISSTLVVLLSVATATFTCSTEPRLDELLAEGDGNELVSPQAQGGPAVELPSSEAGVQALDPSADPRTPLGALRARYFPIWTEDLDSGFPPAVCETSWELDGIAEPVSGVDITHYGDAATMAALGVMRFEYLRSRALATPHPLAQLCVAVGSVGEARAEVLDELVAQVGDRSSDSAAAAFPQDVTMLAAGPARVLAVACTDAQLDLSTHSTSATGSADAEAYVGAYQLAVVYGLEDSVVDISLRVSRHEVRSASNCADQMPAWIDEWDAQVRRWIEEGQIWTPIRVHKSVSNVCRSAPLDGLVDCPRDWSL